jgi:hypothetical protein
MPTENHHRRPCASCHHRDMHSTITGCTAVEDAATNTWCDCTTYMEPQATTGRIIPARNTDPSTSDKATKGLTMRANSQRSKMLAAFAGFGTEGATDEQAMEAAIGVSPLSEYAKRSSELREAGLIEPVRTDTGAVVTRKGGQGAQRIVSRVTDEGRKVLALL